MIIGFVLDDSLDKTDGVQQYVITLGQWFAKHDHEVHYLVGETKRNDIPRVHSLSKNIQVHFNQNRMSTPIRTDTVKLKKLLNDVNFDILHIQMPFSPLMAGKIIKYAHKSTAIIGTFHIIPASFIEYAGGRLLRIVSRGSLKRFDKIYSVSNPAMRFAKRSLGVNSQVLPNTVDYSLFNNGKAIAKYEGKVNIVFLGRLVERKGCRQLLEAMEYIHSKHETHNIRVIICGKGPLESSLKNYVKEKKLGSFVKFVGYISEKDKPKYLATADIAVFPSTGGESFGIVLIEAMAAGAKVVLAGNNNGYISVMNGHADQIVNPNNIPSFSKVLWHFILNRNARLTSYKWQKEYVQKFDVKKVGSILIDNYTSAIAKRRDSVNNIK